MLDGYGLVPDEILEKIYRAMLELTAERYPSRKTSRDAGVHLANDNMRHLEELAEERRADGKRYIIEVICDVKRRLQIPEAQRVDKAVIIHRTWTYRRDIERFSHTVEREARVFDLIMDSEDDWQLSALKGAFHREIIAPCECNDSKGLTVILDTTFYADIQFDDDVLSENLILSCKEAQKVAKAKHSLNHDNLDYFYRYWRDGAHEEDFHRELGIIARPMPSGLDDKLLLACYPPMDEGSEEQSCNYARNDTGFGVYACARL
ncbi:hypothetical protein QFC20_003761 [Naganishia adeliensis]|uniref:Uncharacterized protein n=1 Tax=Naganishia adeliensis TaxID=92952 RepID=A0ACC2W731_9TREE|nr:hypothetical protein QFC20_003761 [Naganishia adeliensis]